MIAPRAAKNGVYCAPPDVARVRATLECAGVKWIVVELAAVRDKSGLLGALAHALEFPAGFGDNWDALADSLEDLSWLGTGALAVELLGSDAYAACDPAAWGTVLDIFVRAATYWRRQGRVFVVLAHGIPGLPAYDA